MMALRGDPGELHRRLRMGQEYIAVARSTGSADLAGRSLSLAGPELLRSPGNLDELEVLLEQYDSLSSARFGLHQYRSGAHRVTLSLLRGEWTDLEARIEALLEIGTRTRREDADGVYGAQMFALNRDLGRLHAMAPR